MIRLLYLEDDADMRIGLKDYFDNTDFEIQLVGNEREFLKTIEANPPRVVIADNDITGHTFDDLIINAVKGLRNTGSEIILVGCTALGTSPGMIRDQVKKGYDAFFDNDGSEDHLNTIVQYILDNLI